MALMVGTGPFGHQPGGVWNKEMPERRGLIWFEDSPRRIRGELGGVTVIDSTHAKLLHEQAHLPVYYFPEADVRMDLLRPSDLRTRCPFKGDASHWTLEAGGQVAEHAAWSYPDPIEGAPALAGYVAFYWNKLDRWFEEDERAIVHARDPYHRIDVLQSSRRIRVLLDGEVLAQSDRPIALFETGLPTRWYLPAQDVRMDLLERSETSTGCAYKGFAGYWSLRNGGEGGSDVAWDYREPHRDVIRITDLIAFFNERVDIEVDGELQERPITQWSRRPPHALAPH
jgi:uncharacterized protein (DUF427 family)